MSPGVMDDSAKCDRLELILEEWVGGFWQAERDREWRIHDRRQSLCFFWCLLDHSPLCQPLPNRLKVEILLLPNLCGTPRDIAVSKPMAPFYMITQHIQHLV